MILLDRDDIAGMIPHEGAMCLLDGVLSWTAETISCISRRYADPSNPLRRADGTVGAASGIELAGQAMAVHGRLTTQTSAKPRRGYLASLRDVRLGAVCLDIAAGDLIIDATLLTGDVGGASYRFTLTQDGAELLSGRATVLFEAIP